jgi:cytochrome c2
MNSTKVNMYVGTIIGSLLFFLLLGFFSELIYVGRGHPEHEALAFAIEIEAEAEEAEEAGTDFAALVAAAELAKGEKLFSKCKACHKVEDGANGVGPHLWGVVGRDIASVAGFSYSDTLAGIDGNWDLETLQAFLEAPKAFAPGTKMAFKGLPKIEDRINLIVYLNEADGSPAELASATAAESPDTEVAAATEPATEPAAEPETTAAEPAEAPEAEPAAEPAAETAEDPAAETAAEPETAAASTEAEPETTAAASGGGDSAELFAGADAGAGEKIFRKCKACHKVEEGKNGVGPSLWGVVGRDIASVGGYKYSPAMKGQEGDWTPDKLFIYLENPKAFVPGTRMKFPGLKNAQDRINVIAYLNAAGAGSPAAEPAAETATETAEAPAASEPAAEPAEQPVAEPEAVATATEGEPETPAAASGGGDFAELLAAADAGAGEKVFKKCKACHKVEEGKKGVGPSLWGVVGRDIGSAEGFRYSDAMKGQEGNWTLASFFSFLENPKTFMPGNKMKFPGLKDPQDRINVITYLNEADGSPEPLQ